jgi:hypothetical protein
MVFEIRHHATVIGRVSDELTRQPIAGAEVVLTGIPQPMRVNSRPDGLFSFLDVPEGTYSLLARWPEGLRRYGEKSGEVKVAKQQGGRQIPKSVELALAPTTIRGRILDPEGAGIPIALVQLAGGFDSCHADREGRFVLAGIEPGKRELLISARGYKPHRKIVELSAAGEQKTVDDLRLDRV